MRVRFHRDSRQKSGGRVYMPPGPHLGRPGHCTSASARGCRPHSDAARPPVQNPEDNSLLPLPSPSIPREVVVLSIIPKAAVLEEQRLAKVLLLVSRYFSQQSPVGNRR